MADTSKPGGIRPPDYVYNLAIQRVEDLMVQHVPWAQIVAKLVDEGYTESEETAKNWRREVMRRWAAEDAELRPARKDQWRARLEAMQIEVLGKARAASGRVQAVLYAEWRQLAKLSIIMDGVQAPITIKHEGKVDVQNMTPYEREAEIRDLIAKREAALRGKEGNN